MTAGAVHDRDERQVVELVVDWWTAADLGGARWLAWFIDVDGARCGPYLVDRQIDCPTLVPNGRGIEALAPHERTGRLPGELQDRLGLVHRCGAPTKTGRPCRQPVHTADQRCHVHEEHPPPLPAEPGEQLLLELELGGDAS